MRASAQFEDLWGRVARCQRCLRDPGLGALDRQAFVAHRPIGVVPPSANSVAYLFVAMESSLDWAGGSRRRALELQRSGWRCFNNSPEDLTFHYAASMWLIRRAEGYATTDLAKCALPVAVARQTQGARYRNCLPWLSEEIRLLRPAFLIAVGVPAFTHLVRLAEPGWPPIAGVFHWSVQNQMNVHRYRFARSRVGLPSTNAISRWRLNAYRTRSWHPPDHDDRPAAGVVSPFHLDLLAIYRHQFGAIRSLRAHPDERTRTAARAVGVRVAM